MKPSFRNILLEPKKFFNDLWQVISWPKVIGFFVMIIFFINLGMFIYDKQNPIEIEPYNIDKIQSPYNKEDSKIVSPTSMFGMNTINKGGDALSATPDVKGVFNEKTKGGENLPPVARAEVVTTSLTEGIREGDTIFLSALKSYDPDGSIKDYRWDFDIDNGLGIDAEGTNATVKYKNAGLYTITLMVIDDKGLESTTSLTVNVDKSPDEQPNAIIPGLTTNKIDLDALGFTSRMEIQNALQSTFADFQAESTALLAQAIYDSQKKKLPPLPSLSEIELSVGNDPSNTPPVVDSVNPKEGNNVFELKPVIAAGFYGNNEIDINGIELLVDGKPVTSETMITKFGVQYKPAEDMGYGQHNVMLVVPDSRGLKTVKSWHFNILDPKAENEDLVPKYEDKSGPQIILHYPDENSKNVKPDSDIRVTYDEPVVSDTVEVAVVDLSTNITKFFTGNQIQWNATKTGFVIRPNEHIFDYDRAYQIVVRQEDDLGNKSNFEWYVLGESYDAPEFKITSPESNSSTNLPQITVTGFTDPTYKIVVGDTVAMVDMNGAFKADINLERGKNEILIKATDLKGKESTQYLIITYDPNVNGGNPVLDTQDSPVIMDSSIKDGEVISKVKPQISFVFADTDGIDRNSIVLKVDGVDVTEFSFISKDTITYKPLEALEQGEHSIELIVADTLGNTTDYKMNFQVDAYPDQPTGLMASLTNNNHDVLLIWEGVSNIPNPKYRVYRSTNPNVPLTTTNEVTRDLTDTTWIDTSTVNGVKYYYVVAAVTDNDNLSHPSNEVEIRVDYTAPALKIETPVKNFVSYEHKVLIKGVTDPDAIVEVSVNFNHVGNPVLNDDGTFEFEVDLIEGDNILTIVAKDQDGNETVDVRTVTYKVPDLEAPYPVKKSPMGTDISVSSNIIIDYNEEINPSTFSMILKPKDSTDSVIPISKSDIALQFSNDNKTVTYNPPNDLEYETRYSVEVYVEDISGNESRDDDWEFHTQVKDNPYLEVLTPEPNYIVDRTIIDVSGKTEPNIDLLIRVSTNGGEEPIEYNLKSMPDGFFKKQIELYPYKNNIITVIATDHLGHASMQVVQGLCSPPDKERPLLIINSPEQNAVLGIPVATVTGQSEPDTRITISVNGNQQEDFNLGDYYFSKDVTLYGGQNLIKITATDLAGNQTVVTRTVVYDNQSPLLDVANPIDGLTTNQNKVEVRGMTDREGSFVTMSINTGGEQKVSVLPDGTFNIWAYLSVGNNYIVLKARDNYGNTTEIIKNVYYDPVKGISGASVSGTSTDSYSIDGQNVSSNTATNNSQSNTNSSNVGSLSTNDTIDPSTGEMRYTGGDTSAPSSVTLNPSNGTTTNDPNATINGSTEPEANVSLSQNGITIFDGKSDVNTGGFGTDTTLQEGKNIFVVNASDNSGNNTSNVSIVTLDTKGPSLSVLSPTVEAIVGTEQLVVYGTTEPNTKVVISLGETKTITSDEHGYFNTKVNTGASGNSTLVVKAIDSQLNETVKNIPLTIDKIEPTLTLYSVNGRSLAGIYTNYPNGNIISLDTTNANIVGKTEPYTRISVKSNGNLVGYVTSDQNGDFVAKVSMSTGETTNIQVLATDNAKNSNAMYFRVLSDKEAPIIQVYTNASIHNIKSSSINISGLVKDNSYPVKITFGLNNNPNYSSLNTSDGSFSTTISNLVEGSNVLTLTARDSLGNTSRTTVSVMYFPDADISNRVVLDTTLEEDNTYNNLNEALHNVNPNVDPNSQFVYEQGTFNGLELKALTPPSYTRPSAAAASAPVPIMRDDMMRIIELLGNPSTTKVDKKTSVWYTVSLNEQKTLFGDEPLDVKEFNPQSYSFSITGELLVCRVEVEVTSTGGIIPSNTLDISGSNGSYTVVMNKERDTYLDLQRPLVKRSYVEDPYVYYYGRYRYVCDYRTAS